MTDAEFGRLLTAMNIKDRVDRKKCGAVFVADGKAAGIRIAEQLSKNTQSRNNRSGIGWISPDFSDL